MLSAFSVAKINEVKSASLRLQNDGALVATPVSGRRAPMAEFKEELALKQGDGLSLSRHTDCSAGLEEEDSDLTKVEVDEVLGLVSDVGAEVAAHDAVPGGVVLLVELLLDEGGDVLLDVEALEGLRGDVDGILLHVLGHIGVLDDGFTIGHSVCFLSSWGLLSTIYCDSILKL